MTTCSSSGGARRVFRRRFAVCSLRSRTSRQNSHFNLPLCNPLSLRPKIVSPALSQHHEGRQFKSDLCNQLFFPVNKFRVPCNHPNLQGNSSKPMAGARPPVTQEVSESAGSVPQLKRRRISRRDRNATKDGFVRFSILKWALP